MYDNGTIESEIAYHEQYKIEIKRNSCRNLRHGDTEKVFSPTKDYTLPHSEHTKSSECNDPRPCTPLCIAHFIILDADTCKCAQRLNACAMEYLKQWNTTKIASDTCTHQP